MRVIMDEFVTHPCHCAPWHRRVRLAYRVWNALGRFTDNLKGTNDGEDGFVVVPELRLVEVLDKAVNFVHRVEHIRKIC